MSVKQLERTWKRVEQAGEAAEYEAERSKASKRTNEEINKQKKRKTEEEDAHTPIPTLCPLQTHQ